ncbi:glycosyltransferase family 4 protein [Natranaerofaba carboxydovora]|uniref:glycosyltransferase family 4 protein n=1 Tax=Natranaerofaba carboxydovora TaxID=2742683 RepID=UPI001F13AB27|nr:glycosyltransferase family 4 protein [Natranaerofaba carboxydovora]UMZ74714.1 N,N'-diacetylbacillosaminyl-diphospho-undecaprenol alpha-1,3-N-acetylgalactosaminyltransferase [Natranaerofaba carboxydovora]
MPRIMIISGKSSSLINFRGDLIREWIELGHEVIAAGPEEGVEEELLSLGATFIKIPLNRTGINPVSDIKFLKNLIEVFKKEKPDIVFSYTIKPVIYGSIAAKLAGVKNIYSLVTGLGYTFSNGGFLKQKLLQKLVSLQYKLAFKFNQKVFFQNPDDIQLFKEKKIISDNNVVLVNGSGVNTYEFDYSDPKTDRISFLLIARLIWGKGIGEYIEAARKIKEKYPDVLFMLIGPLDNNPDSVKKKDIEEWESEGIVEYLGEKDDVRPYLKKCSVFVLPSYYREGVPRTIQEAMSVGRPIITTDAPGCRETVVEGENGYLIPTKDSNYLAKTIEEFIKNPDMIKKMGLKSREIAENKFDVNLINDKILTEMGLSRAKGGT